MRGEDQIMEVISSSAQEHQENQFLTFMLHGKRYGIEVLGVKEIIEYTELTTVPLVPDYVRGVLNLRGSVIPVVDMCYRFHGEIQKLTRRSCIIIIEVPLEDGEIDLGILVDEVADVIEIDAEHLRDAPSFGAQIRTEFIRGIGKVKDEFIVLLNLQQVLSVEELTVLEESSEHELAEVHHESE